MPLFALWILYHICFYVITCNCMQIWPTCVIGMTSLSMMFCFHAICPLCIFKLYMYVDIILVYRWYMEDMGDYCTLTCTSIKLHCICLSQGFLLKLIHSLSETLHSRGTNKVRPGEYQQKTLKQMNYSTPSLKLVLHNHHHLGGGFKYYFFHPYLGKWSNLTNIFQMGWNHQLVIILVPLFNSWGTLKLDSWFLDLILPRRCHLVIWSFSTNTSSTRWRALPHRCVCCFPTRRSWNINPSESIPHQKNTHLFLISTNTTFFFLFLLSPIPSESSLFLCWNGMLSNRSNVNLQVQRECRYATTSWRLFVGYPG